MTWSVPVLGLGCNGVTKEGARQQKLEGAVWRPWPEQVWRMTVEAVRERSGLKNALNRGRDSTNTSGVQMGSTSCSRAPWRGETTPCKCQARDGLRASTPPFVPLSTVAPCCQPALHMPMCFASLQDSLWLDSVRPLSCLQTPSSVQQVAQGSASLPYLGIRSGWPASVLECINSGEMHTASNPSP